MLTNNCAHYNNDVLTLSHCKPYLTECMLLVLLLLVLLLLVLLLLLLRAAAAAILPCAAAAWQNDASAVPAHIGPQCQ
jgi:hypothetical protein